jgi:hypothetical protein
MIKTNEVSQHNPVKRSLHNAHNLFVKVKKGKFKHDIQNSLKYTRLVKHHSRSLNLTKRPSKHVYFYLFPVIMVLLV